MKTYGVRSSVVYNMKSTSLCIAILITCSGRVIGDLEFYPDYQRSDTAEEEWVRDVPTNQDFQNVYDESQLTFSQTPQDDFDLNLYQPHADLTWPNVATQNLLRKQKLASRIHEMARSYEEADKKPQYYFKTYGSRKPQARMKNYDVYHDRNSMDYGVMSAPNYGILDDIRLNTDKHSSSDEYNLENIKDDKKLIDPTWVEDSDEYSTSYKKDIFSNAKLVDDPSEFAYAPSDPRYFQSDDYAELQSPKNVKVREDNENTPRNFKAINKAPSNNENYRTSPNYEYTENSSEVVALKQSAIDYTTGVYIIAIVAGISAAATVGLIAFGIGWYKYKLGYVWLNSVLENLQTIVLVTFNLYVEHQHMRYNPLRDEWILVSPHRMLRPWSGQVEKPTNEKIPAHDPSNPLCPGVTRASGIVTPNYTSTYTFVNDFPALLEEGPEPPTSDDALFQAAPAKGTCRVMCFHPRSDVYIATMSVEEVLTVVNEWVKETDELGRKYRWVQIFENRGAMMGCSNPHPHCQIWASTFLPNEAQIKDRTQRTYFEKHKTSMLHDYMQKELKEKERLVYENQEWVVLVPYWAVWPFETMLLPKRHVQRFTDCDHVQKLQLAVAMRVLIAKYDNLFKCSFPYSMGWHGAPTGLSLNEDQSHWTFHGAYYPPLLRSATVKKFMVGYEMFAQSQRDLTAEKAARLLKDLPEIHYTLS
ncbi:hypothetical protein FQA39_LY05231 [Lamprigera yunnana]|nr:hypothetical protein FQA39_LY05231 [Lamprigera yunnana]